MGYARLTKRESGWFYVGSGGQPTDEIQRVVLCKSPIDALSLATISVMPQQRTMYMAADSPKSLPLKFLQTRPKVIAAFGNDDAGNEMAQAIKQMLPQTIVVRPVALNWNEELRSDQALKEKQHNSEKRRGLSL